MKTKTIEIQPFDPTALTAALDELANGGTIKVSDGLRSALARLLEPPRPLLGGLIWQVLVEHGNGRAERGKLGYLSARFKEALAATHNSEMTRGGYGHDLTPFFVQDPKAQAKWRALADWLSDQTEAGAGHGTVEELFELFSSAGDLRETLEARRTELDRAIRHLDAAMISGHPAIERDEEAK